MNVHASKVWVQLPGHIQGLIPIHLEKLNTSLEIEQSSSINEKKVESKINNKLEYSQQLISQNQINVAAAYRMQFGCNPNDLSTIKAQNQMSSSGTFSNGGSLG